MAERCAWAKSDVDIVYHDEEWGVPVHDDRHWFEMLTLEGAQAGLSWTTILRKRDAYRKAFADFDPAIVARFNEKRVTALMNDDGIVRNRLKIMSTITNARAFLELQRECGSFDNWIWQFVPGRKPMQPERHSHADVPARTLESDAMSKALTKREFRFVGSTICYALMQATGMVNDHVVTCFRHKQVQECG